MPTDEPPSPSSDPIPQPMPVQPLEYQAPKDRRPGILTAVGVISLVLGCFGFLMALSSILSSIAFLFLSRMSFPTSSPTTFPTVIYSYSSSGASPATARSTTPTVPGMFPFSMSHSTLLLTLTTGIVAIPLAILLFVAGIKMLRDSRGAIRLHWIYVWLKIPLVLVGSISSWLWYTSMFNNAGGQTTMQPAWVPLMAASSAIVSAGFSLIYPVALIIVLSNQKTKTYFATLHTT